MLSVLPSLLFLAPFAAFLLRLAAAAVFGYAAWQHAPRSEVFMRVLTAVEIVVAAGLLGGALTQVAAIVGGAVTLVWFFVPSVRPVAQSTVSLLLAICLSLLLTGAGAVSFDLPL